MLSHTLFVSTPLFRRYPHNAYKPLKIIQYITVLVIVFFFGGGVVFFWGGGRGLTCSPILYWCRLFFSASTPIMLSDPCKFYREYHSFQFLLGGLDTACHRIIPCLLSVCFDDAMHGRYASFYVNKGIKVNSSGGGRRMMLCVGFYPKLIPASLPFNSCVPVGGTLSNL